MKIMRHRRPRPHPSPWRDTSYSSALRLLRDSDLLIHRIDQTLHHEEAVAVDRTSEETALVPSGSGVRLTPESSTDIASVALPWQFNHERWLPTHGEKSAAPKGQASIAVSAFDEVKGGIGLSVRETARIVGLSHNTVQSWRKGEREPYPATIRRLLEVSSLVSALRGKGWTPKDWTEKPPGLDESYLSVLERIDGPEEVSRLTHWILFTSRQRQASLVLDEDDVHEKGPAYIPNAIAAGRRRRN